MRNHLIAIILLLFLSFWAIRPILASGFFPMHDDTQVSRVIVMGKALRLGQFPVRWVSDLGYGYGYPIFNFYGPLPYYIGGIFYAAGVDALIATKIMFILGIVLAGVGMYVLTQEIVGISGGILAALLYIYAPYHAVEIYVRGAVGEFWVLVFLPLIILGLWHSFIDKKRYAPLIGGLGLAGVIVSHTILGYITTFFLISFFILYWSIAILRRKLDRSLLFSHIFLLIIGLGVSASFWLPAFFEMQFTNVAAQIGGAANFHDHFICISQLWDSPWGYGGSSPGCIDGFSLKLGKIHILLALASVSVFFLKGIRIRSVRFLITTGISSVLFSLFFALPVSESIWSIIPFFAYVQYPWRFLTFTIFGLSLMGGTLLFFLPKVFRWFLFFVITLGIIYFNGKLFTPQYIYQRSAQAFESEEDLRFRVSKISDEYLPPQITRPESVKDIVGDTLPQTPNVVIDTDIDTDTYSKFIVTAQNDQSLLVRRAYFPGWEYWVNGKKMIPMIEHGLPRITVPMGRSVVEFWFRNTPIRTLANAISIIIVVVLFFIYGKKTII